MKLTTQRLKKLIREELSKIKEQDEGFYGSPEQVMHMEKIMPMFDVYSKGVNEETARLASELAVQMGLGDAVQEQLLSMLAAMKKQRQKGRNMFQHEEDKQKLDSFISILQQVMMDNEENKPPVTYPEEGPDLSDYL